MTRDDVAYVLIHNAETDQVLMVHNETYWGLPGGKREDGETLIEAARREAKEETGFDVAVGNLVHVSERHIRGKHVLFVTFLAEITGGEISTEDSEIQSVEWKSIAEAEALMPFMQDIRPLLTNFARYAVEE
ncbi:hypothetical protein CIG75_04540 [Tumebacillus algifaecis]|uniref:Nudix hydrolase domain-containing protein n=1 Tax=Tumebacillus algifaecis TaxID=1214604 RepID=A0A223D697_9BACL|nr:hypothetical protein CIG75_04540 [Tumebacillus algifaecis]